MKTTIKSKIKIHNKFHIEVTDSINGELKKEAFAENVVTDEMLRMLVESDAIFTQISLGDGVGSPSPSISKLFSEIGRYNVTIDESIKAYPISSVTKKAVIGVGVLTGKTITEVGISGRYAGRVATHAMLKDSEGMPLNIYKSELDIVTIYATLYFELIEDPNAKGKMNKTTTNDLIYYITNGQALLPMRLFLGSVGGDNQFNKLKHVIAGPFSLTRYNDIQNRKIVLSTRLLDNQANFDIKELAVSTENNISSQANNQNQIFRVDLEDSHINARNSVREVALGTGDGIVTEYPLIRSGISDLVVKVDGLIKNDYSATLPSWDKRQIMDYMIGTKDETYYSSSKVYLSGGYRSVYSSDPEIFSGEFDPEEIMGLELIIERDMASTYYSSTRLTLEYSNNNVDWEIVETKPFLNLTDPYIKFKIGSNYKFLRLLGRGSGSTTYTSAIKVYWSNPETSKIVFDNPPAIGEKITASYTVPYIPKTSDYVLDLSFEIQWV